MRRRVLTGGLAVALFVSGGSVAVAETTQRPRHGFPATIDLPAGFQPEGISIGRGTTFYVGSRVDGRIYRGDVRTGRGEVFIPAPPPPPGTLAAAAIGTEVDPHNRLFVAGGAGGTGRIYDARTGNELWSRQFTTETTFVNDVVVTRSAAYFTDSLRAVLYVVPLTRRGGFGEPRELPLTGDFVLTPNVNNANGIEASPDGRTLLVVQSNTGFLFAVDARTGAARQVDLGGYTLTNGDGLLRRGSTLYVVQNRLNLIAVVELTRSYRSGTVVDQITEPGFDVPATVAAYGGRYLYAVNARFTTPATPTTPYAVIRVDLH
jgi:sugar lactone lactonase YvrE